MIKTGYQRIFQLKTCLHYSNIEAEKDKVCEVYCPRTDDLYTPLNGTKLSLRQFTVQAAKWLFSLDT